MASASGLERKELNMVLPISRTAVGIDYSLFLDCVHCGLCTSSCPTYLETGLEADSPRGRIYLMRALIDGRLTLDPVARRHLDLCLDCRACESACPSGVQYGNLIEPFRAKLSRTVPAIRSPDWTQRLLLFHITPFADRTRAALAPVRLLQLVHLDKWIAKTGILRLLPPRFKQLYEMVPPMQRPTRRLPEVLLPRGRRRARVALFTGCAGDAFFPATNWAAARVLQHNGCEVWIPRRQVCCGALHYHACRPKKAVSFARQNCKEFDAVLPKPGKPLDAIVVTAAGCGAMLKDYGHLLAKSPAHAHGVRIGQKVKDISEFLIELGCVAPTHALPIRAVYHDACHLCHAQQIRSQPRQLLKMIPGLKLLPLAESEVCCGAAGSYNVTEPEMAERLGRRKTTNILESKAEALIAGNVGCLLHLGRYMRASNPDLRMGHPVDALWASYSGQIQAFAP
jgi:glycolate dehydrogenase iron-sulfur subunit